MNFNAARSSLYTPQIKIVYFFIQNCINFYRVFPYFYGRPPVLAKYFSKRVFSFFRTEQKEELSFGVGRHDSRGDVRWPHFEC